MAGNVGYCGMDIQAGTYIYRNIIQGQITLMDPCTMDSAETDLECCGTGKVVQAEHFLNPEVG